MSSRFTFCANPALFIFFFTESTCDARELLLRRHERAGDEEPGQLVAGEQRLRHERVARHTGVGGVAEHGAADVVGPAGGAQHLDALHRVALALGWRSQSKSWIRPVRPQRSSSSP
jgi:uncharacterized protein involved in type VI secretion and phage assembly